jgi:uncharacterized protein
LIVYADSSVLVRAYLEDEPGHAEAVALLVDPESQVVTGSWSRIEVSGAIVRAARTVGRPRVLDEAGLLTAWHNDTTADGIVTVLNVPQDAVETRAIALVRAHGLRAMDAWHLAAASIVIPDLVEPEEKGAFASRDAQQAAVAQLLGFTTI